MPGEPEDAIGPAGADVPAEGPDVAPPMAGDEPAPESDATEDDAPFEEGLVGLVEESEMVEEGSDAGPTAPPETAREEDAGPSLEAIALEQSQLIQRDSAMSEQRVAGITDANRQRIGGESAASASGIAALLTRSSTAIQTLIAGKQAEVRGIATGVLTTAQGLVTGAVQTAQATAAAGARPASTDSSRASSASLQGRVQGIAQTDHGRAERDLTARPPRRLGSCRAAAGGIVNRAAGAVTGGLGSGPEPDRRRCAVGSADRADRLIADSRPASRQRADERPGADPAWRCRRPRPCSAASATWSCAALRRLISVAVIPAVNQIESTARGRALGTAQGHAVAAIR